jgi:hypothetical protein
VSVARRPFTADPYRRANLVARRARRGARVERILGDLVAGSGLVFEERGERELKGILDRWRLYRVVSESR